MNNLFSFRVGDKIPNKDNIIETLQQWKNKKTLTENICLLINQYLKQAYKLEFYQKLQNILELFSCCDEEEQQIIINLLSDKKEHKQEKNEVNLQVEKPVNSTTIIQQEIKIDDEFKETIFEEEEDPYM